MGCDIHLHVEVKINNKWEKYSSPRISRNYKLFGLMADVRQFEGYFEPRGMPKDASQLLKLECKDYGVDGHSHSWLSFTDLQLILPLMGNSFDMSQFGYINGAYITDSESYPLWVEDLRVVFWFDN